MSFSRGKKWKIVMMNIASLVILTFLIDTITESSGLNRYLKRKDTKNGIGHYAKIDNECNDNDEIDNSITLEYTKEYPFRKTFIYTILVFGCVYLALKLISILKCTYYGYNDKKGCTHIENVLFFDGKINTNIAFSLEIILLIILSTIAPMLKEKFCNKNIDHKNIGTIIYGCILSISIHIIFQYTGMYGTNEICEK